MTEPMPNTPPPGDPQPPQPLVINGTKAAAIQAVLVSLALACVTVAGGISTLLTFWETRDIKNAIDWLRGGEAGGVISALLVIGGIGGIIWRSAKRKWREVYLAANAPNEIAVVVGGPAPAPLRAPETVITGPQTRLVDAGVLLHRPVAVAEDMMGGKVDVRASDIEAHRPMPYDPTLVKPQEPWQNGGVFWFNADGESAMTADPQLASGQTAPIDLGKLLPSGPEPEVTVHYDDGDTSAERGRV